MYSVKVDLTQNAYNLQEPSASYSAVCQCGREHQRQSEEDRPATFQGLLATFPGQPQGPRWEGKLPTEPVVFSLGGQKGSQKKCSVKFLWTNYAIAVQICLNYSEQDGAELNGVNTFTSFKHAHTFFILMCAIRFTIYLLLFF